MCTLKGAKSAFQGAKCDCIKKPLNGEIYFSIFLYENQTAFDNGEEMSDRSNACYMSSGESANVNLHEGMIMMIDGGSAMIHEVKPAWAP